MESLSANKPSNVASKNFIVLIFYNVVLRTGWIFKTETIIIPAILDYIGGSGWLRGWLPMLNRLGQNVPPILASERLRQTKLKKRVLASASFLMGASFLVLAFVWRNWACDQPNWLPFFFLVIYGLFWLCVGIHNLSLSLLYGKLVEVESRGQLMLIAMSIGSATAIGAAWFWMGDWLSGGLDTFVWLFVFTGTSMVIGSAMATLLIEEQDEPVANPKFIFSTVESSWRIVKSDSNFQTLALVSFCFGVGVTLMPHYQAYVKQTFKIQLVDFVPLVVSQNLGAAIFSIPLGKLSDRYGNRLALRTVMLLLCLAPILTVILVSFRTEYSKSGFYFVFFLLGLMPVSMRTFSNYTLEIADRDRQPIYLSSLGICMALPVIFLSVFVGWLVDAVNFQKVFLIVLAILLFGWTLTFRLSEPRTDTPADTGKRNQTISIE